MWRNIDQQTVKAKQTYKSIVTYKRVIVVYGA